jgi:integrase
MPKNARNPRGKNPTQSVMLKIGECLYRNETSGTYYALVKRHGRQIRRSLKTNDKTLAQRRLAEFRESVSRLSTDAGKRRMNFRQLCTEWLATAGATLKASSLRRNELCVQTLCKSFGEVKIGDITRDGCEAWERSRGALLCESSFNKEADVLKRALDYAVEKGLLLENPAKAIRHRRVVDKAVVIPSKAEFASLLDAVAAESPRNGEAVHLIQLLAYSGMRLGEATRIVWREVDFERRPLHCLRRRRGDEKTIRWRSCRSSPLREFSQAREERGVCSRWKRSCAWTRQRRPSLGLRSRGATALHASLPAAQLRSNAIELGVDFKTIAHGSAQGRGPARCKNLRHLPTRTRRNGRAKEF